MTIENLIAECTAYDLKEMLEENRPKSWLKSVSAFANTMGGSLFFGVDNDCAVKGLEDIQHVSETISLKIRDYMDPLPEVEMIPLEQEGKHLLQLKVKGEPTRHIITWVTVSVWLLCAMVTRVCRQRVSRW